MQLRYPFSLLLPLTILTTYAYATDEEVSSASSIVSQGELINQVEQVAGIANKYGLTVTVLAVFLVLFMVFMGYQIITSDRNAKTMAENMKREAEQNREANQKMLEAIIAFANGTSISPNPSAPAAPQEPKDTHQEASNKQGNLMKGYIDSSIAFKDASRIAMEEIKCDRIAIYLFHNGNKSHYGYQFAKMSCIHEWTSRGIQTSRRTHHTNLPIYVFDSIVESLISDNEFVVGNISEYGILTDITQVQEFIAGSHVKAMFALGIRDHDNNLAAFTIAEFKDPRDFAEGSIYDSVKKALTTMNRNIISIIINDQFRSGFEEEHKDS